MKVFLDGELMARLSPGDSVDLAGPDGVIEVRAKIDWTYSAPLKVTDPVEAEVVRVVVGFRAPCRPSCPHGPDPALRCSWA
jgi:hypothetical protein